MPFEKAKELRSSNHLTLDIETIIQDQKGHGRYCYEETPGTTASSAQLHDYT